MATRMKEKAALRKANADKRPRAVARYQRISTRKAKIVLDLIRGKAVNEALAFWLIRRRLPAPSWRSWSIRRRRTLRTT